MKLNRHLAALAAMTLTTMACGHQTTTASTPATVQESAATAETRHVQVDGVSIAYRRFGSGSALVLANRMRGTIDTWDPAMLDKLAERHTVITFDYPGVGYSSGTLPDDMGRVARVINDFTKNIGLGEFAMLGWSWGGFATQTLLLDHPERVTHAILIGTNPPGPAQMPIQQVFIERAIKPINDLGDEEVLFFEPRSEFSRAAAKASRDRIYSRPDVVSKIGQMRNAQFMFYSEAGHGPQHQYPELSAEYIADLSRARRSSAAQRLIAVIPSARAMASCAGWVPIKVDRAGSIACSASQETSRPGRGGRHQHVGGPPACGHIATS